MLGVVNELFEKKTYYCNSSNHKTIYMNGIKYYLNAIKNYATFTGRARRREYWYFVLFNVLASMLFAIIGLAIGFHNVDKIYSLVVFIPGLAVCVRRIHDTGKSGWYILIPIYNFILLCTDGDYGPNDYGYDPKGTEEEMTFDFDNDKFNEK
jgi:uncharacterized membrane protein YhaH (DUF805 family)